MLKAIASRTLCRTFRSILVVMAAAMLAACMTQSVRPQATDLATTGAATMGAIANYYTLVQTTYETGIRDAYLQDALIAQTGPCKKHTDSKACSTALENLDPGTRVTDLAKMRTGIDSRRRLAIEMQALYASFGEMANEDLEPTFGAQGQSLVQAISKVTNTPLPDAVGTEIFKAIAVQIQNRTLGKGEHAIRTLVTAFDEQFAAEMPAWDSVFKVREDAIPYIVQTLLELDLASSQNLSGNMVEAYALTTGSKSLVDFAVTKKVLIGWTAMESYRLTEDSRTAMAAARQSLNGLVAAHEAFPKSQGSLANALDAASRVNAIVDAFDAWKKAQAAAKKAAADAGAAGSD